MKRTLALLLALSCVIGLFGCKQPEASLSNPTTDPTSGTTLETTAPTEPEDPTDPESTDPVEPPPVQLPEPDMPTVWVANCSDYINFRSTPGGTKIGTIPAGGTMELISWNEKYAKVNYNGTVGYVSAGYIKPADEEYFAQCLDVVKVTNEYTYDRMMTDIAILQSLHSDVITVSTIGKSELGRDIPVICIGDLDAEYHVLFQGAMHAREYLTSWLLMALTEYWVTYDVLKYGDVCYHIIPMINPDGVTLAQTQTLTAEQYQIYLKDKADGFTTSSESYYASQWKANGVGVDLNRNFPSGWEKIDDRTGPSSEFYQGTAPFSASETAALRDYTFKYDFDTTISYHSSGSIIYYEYGTRQPVNAESLSLGWAVNAVSGYTLIGNTSGSGAGYKDWVMDELGIPSLTIEIGVDGSPLAMREIYSIFVRNLQVLPAIAEWIQK